MYINGIGPISCYSSESRIYIELVALNNLGRWVVHVVVSLVVFVPFETLPTRDAKNTSFKTFKTTARVTEQTMLFSPCELG